MAIISVTATDVGNETVHWQVPPDNSLNESPIPRGLRIYQGTAQIAILGAGDETDFLLHLTVPLNFIYLPKTVTVSFLSDDITSEFGNIGILEYRPGSSAFVGVVRDFEMISAGPSFRLAVRSIQTYRPQGEWRQWLVGSEADRLSVNIQDMSGDASAAGDVAWYAEFWEYDIEQCFKWPVNTPQPTIAW